MAAAINAVGNAARKAVNAFATDAFTTSGASGLYHRARPSYPTESVEKLLSVLGNKKDVHIVEVGAGTGLFTECLVRAAGSSSGSPGVSRITAVEPSSGMREGFEKNPLLQSTSDAEKSTKISIVDGSFAEMPFPISSADIIVGAQCWHWAHPNYAEAIAEFGRVLKPGGTLAFIWNLEDRKYDWVAKVRDTYEAYEKGTPQYRLGWWKETFKTSAYKESFKPPESFEYSIAHPTSEQGVVDRIMSKSYITAQPAEEQAKIDKRVRAIFEKGDDRKWIDESQGTFEYPYITTLYLMEKKA